ARRAEARARRSPRWGAAGGDPGGRAGGRCEVGLRDGAAADAPVRRGGRTSGRRGAAGGEVRRPRSATRARGGVRARPIRGHVSRTTAAAGVELVYSQATVADPAAPTHPRPPETT